MKKPRWLLIPAMAVVAAVAVACGGEDTGSGGSVQSGSGGTSTRELNFPSAMRGLEDLRSFRMDLSFKLDLGELLSSLGEEESAFASMFLGMLSNVKVEAAYVAPDSFSAETNLFGEKMKYVQIGRQAWVNEGSGWQETGAEDFLGGLGSSPTELLKDFLPQEVLEAAETKQETVNGVKATRYSFDRDSLEDLADDYGEDFGLNISTLADIEHLNLDVWVSEGGIPVKASMLFEGQDPEGNDMSMELELNITDINSDSVKIRKPV
jgi:hypothetical protein